MSPTSYRTAPPRDPYFTSPLTSETVDIKEVSSCCQVFFSKNFNFLSPPLGRSYIFPFISVCYLLSPILSRLLTLLLQRNPAGFPCIHAGEECGSKTPKLFFLGGRQQIDECCLYTEFLVKGTLCLPDANLPPGFRIHLHAKPTSPSLPGRCLSTTNAFWNRGSLTASAD